MHTQDFIINQSSNREAIEAICEYFPKLDCVSTLALVIKSVDAIDTSALVISSEQKKVFGELNFVSE